MVKLKVVMEVGQLVHLLRKQPVMHSVKAPMVHILMVECKAEAEAASMEAMSMLVDQAGLAELQMAL